MGFEILIGRIRVHLVLRRSSGEVLRLLVGSTGVGARRDLVEPLDRLKVLPTESFEPGIAAP